ncbi:hypothetical protein AARAC_006543 [Aspergillus arachidicola]|uniref:Alpha/beta hydrolase fold-3 domain-containing protein n=1 Tax=Aspergillus arachidicola TaxID=656916 RepID=A0A2G7G921_9EURO|nr:hypothetical protein AARAC_006543 [Aspergillus arachidicola]
MKADFLSIFRAWESAVVEIFTLLEVISINIKMSILIKPNEVSPSTLAARQQLNQVLEAKYIGTRQWYEYPSIVEFTQAQLDGTTGGFCMSSARSNDSYLRHLAERLSMTVVTADYRRAPEHPFPAPQEDALDAALFALSPEGERELRGQLKNHWVSLLVLILARIKGLVALYGIYDLTYLPSARNYSRRLMPNNKGIFRFIDTALPLDKSPLDVRKRRHLSPLYGDLTGLPPALFLVGSEDPVLDDSVFLATKWAIAGTKHP